MCKVKSCILKINLIFHTPSQINYYRVNCCTANMSITMVAVFITITQIKVFDQSIFTIITDLKRKQKRADINNIRDMVKHELQVTSYQLRGESLKARVKRLKARIKIEKCELKSTSYDELRVQMHELRVPIHELRVQIHELRVQIHEF